MHIKSVEFAGAIGQIGQPGPESVEGLTRIAFSGRSNVGKSTLVNRILGRTRTPIARVSATPGKTQEINFFRVRSDVGDFALVDLPGYGFAKAPAPLRERWRALTDDFLTGDNGLAGVVQLIDIRHGPTPDDLKSIAYLAELGLPVLFVLTKSDKLGAGKRRAAITEIVGKLEIDASQVIAFSSLSGEGVEELRETLGGLISAAAEAREAEKAREETVGESPDPPGEPDEDAVNRRARTP